MNSTVLQSTRLNTTRQALLVLFICYIPHFATSPWWLFLFILIAMAYRLIADYYSFPLLPKSIRLILIILCLFLLKMHYGSIVSNGFFIGFLLLFVGLKIIETHQFRDLKILVFCNFYLIFAALIMTQELWTLIYLVIAVLANCLLMIKLHAPQASLKHIGGASAKQVLMAIPLTIVLFYLFPRLANPLWQVPAQSLHTTGFSEQMSPGSIADLFDDDRTALRVTFKNEPILNGYWRGLILSIYNGVNWSPVWYRTDNIPLLPTLKTNTAGDYEVLLEPHQKKWLFYTGYPVASRPNLLFSAAYGLVSQNNDLITQRFSYELAILPTPYQPLNAKEIALNTQLPKKLNPRLNAWAKEEYARQQYNTEAFIRFLEQYINQHTFWYTLSPPALSANKNQMDTFWFDTQKGFCEHYASAVTVILRSIGIPAHVLVGYQGGEWNPLGQYLNIQQNDAHAWLEYWQDGVGWQQFDPTSFIARERIEQRIQEHQANRLNLTNFLDSTGLPWFQRTRLALDSARFFTERWLLFYNQETQRDLLQKIGLAQWGIGQLLQAAIAALILFLLLLGLYYHWTQKRAQDPLLIEYHLLQQAFRRFNVFIAPSSTLKQQCEALMNKAPKLTATLTLFLYHYEQLRLHPLNQQNPEKNKKETIRLFKILRKKLKQNKPSLQSNLSIR